MSLDFCCFNTKCFEGYGLKSSTQTWTALLLGYRKKTHILDNTVESKVVGVTVNAIGSGTKKKMDVEKTYKT